MEDYNKLTANEELDKRNTREYSERITEKRSGRHIVLTYQRKIGVVGATGAVGQATLEELLKRGFPARNIHALGSSSGKSVSCADYKFAVSETTEDTLSGLDYVFISAGEDISARFAPLAVKHGAVVIDDSAYFRMDTNVPLVVPEVNGYDMFEHKGIISIPNCVVTPLVMVLKPLLESTYIKRVRLTTFQSVSGAGKKAWKELLDNPTFNVVPKIGDFVDSGYTTEEVKIEEETRKILHRPDLPVSATCVRVPVEVGHCASVSVEFNKPMSPQNALSELTTFDGLKVREHTNFPTPLEVKGKDDVFVGRVRRDTAHPNGLVLWVAGDNLKKGAALNSVQILEDLIRQRER